MRQAARWIAVATALMSLAAPAIAAYAADGGGTAYSERTGASASDPLQKVRPYLNPVVCPVFMEIGNDTGGHIAGAILIAPDGDVYVAQPIGPGYNREWDCPPY